MKHLIFTFILSIIFPAFAYDQSSVGIVFTQHKKEVMQCYNDQLKKDPTIKGKLTVDFRVDDHGDVTETTISETQSQLMDLTVRNCILDLVKSLKFAPAPEEETAKLSYPFVFSSK